VTVVELGEYSTSEATLPYADAAAVVAVSAGALSLADVTPTGARLAARQHVGVVATDRVEVRILSKVPAANVLGMLAASTGIVKWLPGSAQIGLQDDLLRSAVAFFAREVADLLAAGPQRHYRVEHDALVAPRGRLNVTAMARQGGLPAPVHCRFDEYTEDSLLHRYLVTAIHRALRVPGLDQKAQRLLRHARAAIPDVRHVALPPDAIDRHHFTRLDERYRPAAALARIVLERLSLHHTGQRHQVRTFTVDMNRLLESWVAARLPDHLPSDLRLDTQTRRHLDEGKTLSIRPDLEILQRARSVYVADTKYKLTDTGLGRITDYYQAHAYATVLGLDEAMLIYCDDGGNTPPHRLRVAGSGISVLTHSMSLNQPYAGLETELAALGAHIGRRVAAPAVA
jgi:5-methylcytosine-specific restriction enzyme subunit McrC